MKIKREESKKKIKNDIILLGISKREAEELVKVSENLENDYILLTKKVPIQYLIGYVNFYGNKIRINKNVLIPRFETETLVEKVIKYIKYCELVRPNILEIGTGSGCISIALKKNINCKVTATDILPKAIELAKNNANLNHVELTVLRSNLFAKINGKYDVIVSNPPYISENEKLSDIVNYEPSNSIYSPKNGLYYIEQIIINSKCYMKNKSILALETGCNQEKEIEQILQKYYAGSYWSFEKDLTGKIRYIFVFKGIKMH